MGMRFRKSINLGGARINISKKGIGASVGTKGARYTKKADGGTRSTLSIPGTGISYVKDSKKKKENPIAIASGNPDQEHKVSALKNFMVVLFMMTWLPTIILSALVICIQPLTGFICLCYGLFEIIYLHRYYKKRKLEDINNQE